MKITTTIETVWEVPAEEATRRVLECDDCGNKTFVVEAVDGDLAFQCACCGEYLSVDVVEE